MKITVLTHKEEVQFLEKLLSSLSGKYQTPLECRFYESYDDFIKGFPNDKASALIIARRGADGMECARNARLMEPSVPLVWLSDDNGFGIESYRIGCTYFSSEPITDSLLCSALDKCRDNGRI